MSARPDKTANRTRRGGEDDPWTAGPLEYVRAAWMKLYRIAPLRFTWAPPFLEIPILAPAAKLHHSVQLLMLRVSGNPAFADRVPIEANDNQPIHRQQNNEGGAMKDA